MQHVWLTVKQISPKGILYAYAWSTKIKFIYKTFLHMSAVWRDESLMRLFNLYVPVLAHRASPIWPSII
jgi:hypothetical protein